MSTSTTIEWLLMYVFVGIPELREGGPVGLGPEVVSC